MCTRQEQSTPSNTAKRLDTILHSILRYLLTYFSVSGQQLASHVTAMNIVYNTSPCNVCNCSNTNVNCSGLGLVTIPLGLPNTTVVMDFSYNNLTVLPDNNFSVYRFLRHLDLSHNHLHTLSVDVFFGLALLQSLNLSWNNLSLSNGTYPQGVFKPMNNSLVELHLNGNTNSNTHSWDYPDAALSDLRALQALHMDGLINPQFGPGFQNLTSLRNVSFVGLDVGFCEIHYLANSTFVHFPPSLKFLNMSGCNISCVEADTFRPLRNLDTLDLSDNIYLGFYTLGNAVYGLQGSSLRVLYINRIVYSFDVFVVITESDTRHFRNTSLETIYAEQNGVEVFCRNVLRNMPPTLKNVSLTGNRLRFGDYFQDFGQLTSIERIVNDGSMNPIPPPDRYPHFDTDGNYCSGTQDTVDLKADYACKACTKTSEEPQIPKEFTPPGSDWHITRVKGSHSLIYTLPPKLTEFVSRWNQLHYQLKNITFNPNNSLVKLDLNSNILDRWLGPVSGLPHLKELHLQNNYAFEISSTFFESFGNITHLYIGSNRLQHTIEKDRGILFRPLTKLEILDLSQNNLRFIHYNSFQSLQSLQILMLKQNNIYTFSVNMERMMNIRMIDLSSNYIAFLPKSIMDHLDAVAERLYPNETVRVNMTFNPISCTCQHIDFLIWIQDSYVDFDKIDNYSCAMSDGSIKKMENIFDVITDLRKICSDFTGMFVGAVACGFCLLIALASAILYRFRWKLRYMYYGSRLAYRQAKGDNSDNFKFDAFVSYATEDSDFVHGQLIHRLEIESNLRLNVHNRDFVAGRPIPCNIVAAVQESRHTLVILTRSLLASDWCNYEMEMATMESMHTGRDVLLFLLYEDIPSDELPRQVLYNLQASTYTQFPHKDVALLEDFWQSLILAIRE